jgi:putative DNA primase/helicase
MVETAPAAALVVPEADLLLEFLVVALDDPARLGGVDQRAQRGAGRQVGEPVLARLGLALGPFDQQPCGWLWSVKGLELVPYRLPELLAAPPDQTVFVPEGEKDVDALRALGLVATCNPMGAGKWRKEFGRHLEGRDVVVLPDDDEVGRPHAMEVVAKLAGHAARVRILGIPPPHKDVSDWIVHGGGTAARLLQMVAEASTAGEEPADTEALGDRPLIQLAAGDIARLADEAEAALVAADLGFYQRGAFIVRPATVQIAVSCGRKVPGPGVVG